MLRDFIFSLFCLLILNNIFFSQNNGLSPQIVIKIIAYKRANSLLRLLKSLDVAYYDSRKVPLEILIDAPIQENEKPQVQEVISAAEQFHWSHGPKVITVRKNHLGITGSWLNSWNPNSDNEYAYIAEDDTEVSPHYYQAIRAALRIYQNDSLIYGITLQKPSYSYGVNEWGKWRKIDVEAEEEDKLSTYLFPVIGTWGVLLFPKPWKKFTSNHLQSLFQIEFDGSLASHWSFKKGNEKMWTHYFMRWVLEQRLYSVYFNRPFSISYRETGLNFRENLGPDSALYKPLNGIDVSKISQKRIFYNYCYQRIAEGKVYLNSAELIKDLFSIVNLSSNGNLLIAVVIRENLEDVQIMEWVCQARLVGFFNTLLITSNLDQAIRLSRGHQLQFYIFHNQDKIISLLKTILRAKISIALTTVSTLMLENPIPWLREYIQKDVIYCVPSERIVNNSAYFVIINISISSMFYLESLIKMWILCADTDFSTAYEREKQISIFPRLSIEWLILKNQFIYEKHRRKGDRVVFVISGNNFTNVSLTNAAEQFLNCKSISCPNLEKYNRLPTKIYK